MFLISWNVAGWSSTARQIRDDFGNIATFLNQTHADVVCLQEVKGSWAKLDSDPRGMGASDGGATSINGWETFWSCSSKAHRGFNGVATFVRKGLTWGCDSRPFDVTKDNDLNDEGRVVVTYHSACVIVNTYVVNSRHGLRFEFKMRFLTSLKNLLQGIREATGKPVILVGDLNQTYRAEDAHWSLRRVSLRALQELSQRSDSVPDLEWRQSFPWISKPTVRRLTELVVGQTVNSLLVEDDNPISPVENTNGTKSGSKSISVDSSAIGTVSTLKDDSMRDLVQRIRGRQKAHIVPLATLNELCEAGVESTFMDTLTRPNPPSHNRELFALLQHCGLPPHAEASAVFMQKELLGELHLFDSLLQAQIVSTSESGIPTNSSSSSYSRCPCPYTCWDQSRNKRLTNEGTRIDYILIDEALLPHLVLCKGTENNIGTVSSPSNSSLPTKSHALRTAEEVTFFDEFDGAGAHVALCRTMADGAYAAAPFDGSGLPPLGAAAREIQFRGLPSTGLFVTPPQYSDHCGVCALLEGVTLKPRSGKIDEKHRSMYRPPVGIQSFFAKHQRSDAPSSQPTSVRRVEVERKENGEKVIIINVDEE